MGKIEQSILDSIEILLNKRVSQLDFDKTVRATIVSIIDQSVGRYRVRYQNSIFDAFSADSDASYDTDDQVYVQIPSSDYKKTKLIVGSVKQLGTKYIDAVTAQGKMTTIGSNIFNSTQAVQLCSYNGQQQRSIKNIIAVDSVALSTYKKQRKYILLGMNVRTALPTEQQVSGGNYGLIVQAKYYNTAYKSQDVQSDADLVTRTYVLDVNNMQGQPYKYTLKNRQYAIFSIDGDNLKEISDIQVFCTGFPVTKSGQPADIFLSDFQLEFMEPLTDEELNGSSLKILTPRGAYLTSANDDQKYMYAEMKIKGRKVNYDTQHVDFYWFIKDTTVKSTDSTKFSNYAGEGWRCLNQSKTYNGVTQFIPESQRKDLIYSMVPAAINTFKCVAVYDKTTLSAAIDIENKVSKTRISITSSAGTKFYFDTGKTTLTCNVTTDSPNLSYHWGYRTAGGELTAIDSQDKSINVAIAEATDTVTYECTVLTNGAYLGAAALTLTNGVPQNEYTLVINNGTQVFKYDEEGVSPASNSAEDQITIATLTFDIYNDQGQLVTPPTPEEIVKSCDIKWIWPDEDYTMLRHSTFTLTDDTIVNPTTNGNLLRHVYRNAPSLTFEIANRYDIEATDNNIRLEVNFQGHALVASTNFTFTKDGELGTNGTKYVSRLVPFRDIYKQIYLQNGHIQGWYDTVSKSYNSRTGEYTNVETYVFQQASTNQPLRAQMWNGAAAPLYDSQTNTSFIDADLTWELVDVGRNTTHNAEVYSNGTIAATGYNNVSTVVKTTIETDELSQQAKKYFATYPLTVVRTPNNDCHAIVTGGFTQCMYNSDGTRGAFKTKPFTLKIFIGNVEQVLDNSQISWYTSWYTSKKNLALKGKNNVEIEPPAMYDSESTNNYIVITYGDYKVILSIHLYLNRYGMSAMNDWDGTSIKLNSQGDQYILAPQIGAGQKNDDNTFTGITMGKSFNANGNGQREIGLMGFARGARSIFLDAETGKAQFGLPGKGQIVLAPDKYGAAPAGSIFSWSYYNHDRTGRPTSQAGAGMLIDLQTPSILFGSRNFSVNANGELTARGGGSIANWKISNDKLTSQDGKTTLYSEGGDDAARLKIGNGRFTVYGDGRFKAANSKFSVDSDGNIKATGGTIGGWTITDKVLKAGNITFDAGKNEINVNNTFIVHNNGSFQAANNNFNVDSSGRIVSTAGTIGGWNIGANKLSSASGHIDLNDNGSIISDAWNIQPNGVATFTDVRISSPNSSSTLDWGTNFGVDGLGNMHALSGQIGGWKLDNTGFKGSGISITPQAFNYGSGFSLDPSGNLKSGGDASFGGNFSVSGNVNIKGNGRIGDCILTNGHLAVKSANIESLDADKIVYQDKRIGWNSQMVCTHVDWTSTYLDVMVDSNKDGTPKLEKIHYSSIDKVTYMFLYFLGYKEDN